MLEYKGYVGSVELDEEGQVLCGRVQNIRDVITYEAETVRQLTEEFHKSVDDYLAWCQELGQEPEKPFSGNLAVRIPPELHQQLSLMASRCGESMNSLIAEAIREQLKKTRLQTQKVTKKQATAAKSQSSSAGRRPTSSTRSQQRDAAKGRESSRKKEEQVRT